MSAEAKPEGCLTVIGRMLRGAIFPVVGLAVLWGTAELLSPKVSEVDVKRDHYCQAEAVRRNLGVTQDPNRPRHNAYCLVLDGDSFGAPRLSPNNGRVRVANGTKSGQA